jgi:hypothetical protein
MELGGSAHRAINTVKNRIEIVSADFFGPILSCRKIGRFVYRSLRKIIVHHKSLTRQTDRRADYLLEFSCALGLYSAA